MKHRIDPEGRRLPIKLDSNLQRRVRARAALARQPGREPARA